jgi:hypothetical protein
MSLAEFGETLLWFLLACFLSLLGIGAAILALCLNWFRGTKGGPLPLYLTFFTGLTAVGLWLIVFFADPPVGIIMGAINSAFGMLCITSWLNRSDRL